MRIAWVYFDDNLMPVENVSEEMIAKVAQIYPTAIYFFDGLEDWDCKDTRVFVRANTEFHDAHTMRRVRESLLVKGLAPHKAEELIQSMQYYGILFRERA